MDCGFIDAEKHKVFGYVGREDNFNFSVPYIRSSTTDNDTGLIFATSTSYIEDRAKSMLYVESVGNYLHNIGLWASNDLASAPVNLSNSSHLVWNYYVEQDYFSINKSTIVEGTLAVTTGFTGSCVNTTYSGGIAVSCND